MPLWPAHCPRDADCSHLHHPPLPQMSPDKLWPPLESTPQAALPASAPPLPSCRHPAELASGPVLALAGGPRASGAGSQAAQFREAPASPAPWVGHADHVHISRSPNAKDSLQQCHLLTIPPPHLPGQPPERARGAASWELLQWSPAPIALRSLLFVGDLQRLLFFVLVFSSFHCDTKN